MNRRAVLVLISIVALSLFQMGGCTASYSDDDDGNGDITMTLINNHHDDVVVQVDDGFWGWLFVTHLNPGESDVVDFDDDNDGDDLRARDDGNTVGTSKVRDGTTWSIGSGSGTGGPN